MALVILESASHGLTFVFKNPEDRVFLYGEHYWLYVLEDGNWVRVTPIIDEVVFIVGLLEKQTDYANSPHSGE